MPCNGEVLYLKILKCKKKVSLSDQRWVAGYVYVSRNLKRIWGKLNFEVEQLTGKG